MNSSDAVHGDEPMPRGISDAELVTGIEKHTRPIGSAAKSWDDATPDEIRDARIQSLEEGLEHLKLCVTEALRYGTARPTSESGAPAADILDEEWSK